MAAGNGQNIPLAVQPIYTNMHFDRSGNVISATMSPMWLYFLNEIYANNSAPSFSKNAMLFTDGTATLRSTASLNNGQFLIGATGTYPQVGTLTSSVGIGITPGPGTLTISNLGVTSIAGTINEITSSASAGSVTLSISTTYPGQTSISTVGTISVGTWAATPVGISYGGTGLSTTPAIGQIPIGTGTGYSLNTIKGTTNQIDVANGAGLITLSIDTAYPGQTSITTVGTVNNGVWNGTAVTAAYGGTGLTSPGTAGNVLTSTGTGWVSSPSSGGSFSPNIAYMYSVLFG